ncbi:MAG: glycosyltransferase [Aerococcaceae bacterium]|nr:glycosyltransferase [Aerococcaceae bacterium]
MRVLHIMSGYGGGISSFIRNKAQGVVGHDVVFDVVTYDACSSAFVQAIQQTGGDVYPLSNPKQKGWRAFKASLENVLQSHVYDVVHCHISGYRALAYYRICRKFRIPKFYIHAHFTLEKNQLTLEQRVNQWVNRRLSDAYLGCSLEAVYSAYGWKTPLEQMMVLPNSIDLDSYQWSDARYDALRTQQRERYGIAKDAHVIGHIGRLTPIKNHEFTLQLAHLAKQSPQNIQFLITGAGELETALKQQVVAEQLESIVLFTGRVEPIADLYPALDVLILPSFREGLPTVVVESQAAGVPVVVSDTITHEVDLGVDMVEYCALADLETWWQAIQTPRPERERAHTSIVQAYFANETSAQLYIDFLKGNIQHYRIQGGQHE